MKISKRQPIEENQTCLAVSYDEDLHQICEDILAMQKPQHLAKMTPAAFDNDVRTKMQLGLERATTLAFSGNVYSRNQSQQLARTATMGAYTRAHDALHDGFNLIRDGGVFDPSEVFDQYGLAKANEFVNHCHDITDATGSSEILRNPAHQLPIEANCHSIALVDREIQLLLAEGHFVSIDTAYARLMALANAERTQGLLELATTVSPVTVEQTPVGTNYATGHYWSDTLSLSYRRSLFTHYFLNIIPSPAASVGVNGEHLAGDVDTLGSHREAIGIHLTLEQPAYEYFSPKYAFAIGVSATGGFMLGNNKLNYGQGYVPESHPSFDINGETGLWLAMSFYKVGRLAVSMGHTQDQVLVSDEKFHTTGWYGKVTLGTPLPRLKKIFEEAK